MVIQPDLEEKLKLLSEKEYFYSSLTREDFCRCMDVSPYKAEAECHIEEISTPSVPLLVNESNLQRILEAEQKSDPYHGRLNGKRDGFFVPPFYLYFEEEPFIQFVQNNDIRSLCQKYRVVILVGGEEFENYFCQLDVIFPTVICGDTNKRIAEKILKIQMEKEKLLKELAEEVFLYYQEREKEIEDRVINGTAKICILKNTYEPDGFQKYYKEFQRTLDKLGYSVFICSERGNIFKTNEILNLYQYRPDIVFQINKTRTGTYMGEAFHYLQQVNNLILISWIQDKYPTIISQQCAACLNKHDYIFSFFNERVMQEFKYPNRNVIYGGMMPADIEDFCEHLITAKEHEAYDCDICFMGSFFSNERMTSWIYEELRAYLTDEQIVKVYNVIEEMLGEMYNDETQKYVTDLKTFNGWLDRICKELQCDDSLRLHLHKVLEYTRYQMLRKLIIQQLADSRKYKIIVYGSYLDIEGIECREWIHDRQEVAKAIQCSGIIIQVNPDTTINKRVVEGILSLTPVMVYEVKEEECQNSITSYLEEGEGFFFFNSRQELLDKCDLLLNNQELREKTVAQGYFKVSKSLTNDAVFGYLMDALKEKVRSNREDSMQITDNNCQEKNIYKSWEKEVPVEAVKAGDVVLLANEQDLNRIVELEQKCDICQGMSQIPFYLYYGKEQFNQFTQSNDLTALRLKYRIVILVGEEEFEDYFCQLDAIMPTILYSGTDNWIEEKLLEIKQEKQKLLVELAQEVYLYYKENGEAIKKRILDGNAKICIMQNEYEPSRFKALYGMFKESVEKFGYQVEICHERGSIFRTDDIIKLYQYRPDIVFQINKSRDGRTYQGEAMHYLDKMDNLIFINWVQDFHPQILDKGYAQSLKENDYIFSLFDERIMEAYEYPKEHLIYRGIMPANEKDFCLHSITEEEHKRFDYDICFIGTIMNEEVLKAFVYRELEPYLTQEQIARVYDMLLVMRGNLYNTQTQEYTTDIEGLNYYIQQLKEEFEYSDAAEKYIYRIFCVVRYNSLRKLVLQHLAAQKKYRVVLYGACDINVEGVKYGGMITEPLELSKALFCSKLVLQINPDATINQCVAEGLLSHTPILVYKVREEENMSSISHYLKEREGFLYFDSRQKLIEECDLLLSDDRLREEIAEQGYQKACEVLTSDAVFGHLMRELREKLKNKKSFDKKILLVIPQFYDTDSGGRSYEMPLGSAYINAALRKAGFHVECLNMNHIKREEMWYVLGMTIKNKDIDFVLCGSITPFFSIMKTVFDVAKTVKPDVITIAGGGAVTSAPLEFAEVANIDYGVIGEGEITDVELIATLMEGKDVSKVKGIVYKTQDGYRMTEPREPIENLDEIEFPCYDGFDVEKYLDNQNLAHTYYTYYTDDPRIMPMTLARSCPYQCKFCFHPVGNRYRARSLDNFFEELDLLIEKYQINGIIILDELFSAKVDRVYEFCERIRPYHIHWVVQMRVDIISEELLSTMKAAGCYSISYGLESMSQKVLKNMRKNTKSEEIEHALQLTYETEMDIQGNFIFGDELEDRHTFFETLNWWFKHPAYAINLGMIETYPGTGYYKECVKSGRIADAKQFIQNGNYVINLTQLTDQEYNKLTIIIGVLLWFYPCNIGKILNVYENAEGKVVLETQCAHCGSKNQYVGIDAKIFKRPKFEIGCRHCNHRNIYFSVDPKETELFDRMQPLCQMLSEATDEWEFNQIADRLVDEYLQTVKK